MAPGAPQKKKPDDVQPAELLGESKRALEAQFQGMHVDPTNGAPNMQMMMPATDIAQLNVFLQQMMQQQQQLQQQQHFLMCQMQAMQNEIQIVKEHLSRALPCGSPIHAFAHPGGGRGRGNPNMRGRGRA